jgi:5'-deoxynucleotidase YfbR-like HD superfamily hydrolase
MKIRNHMNLLSRMTTVQRYSQYHLCVPESVLEHSAFVAMISMFIANHIELDMVERCKVIEKALMHDVDEVVTGDISRPVKYHSKELRLMIAAMESENMERISDEILESDRFFYVWRDSKEGKAGSIVALADVLAVVYKLYDEVVMRGNKTLYDIANKDVDRLVAKRVESVVLLYEIDPTKLEQIVIDCNQMMDKIKQECSL